MIQLILAIIVGMACLIAFGIIGVNEMKEWWAERKQAELK